MNRKLMQSVTFIFIAAVLCTAAIIATKDVWAGFAAFQEHEQRPLSRTVEM